MKTIRVISVLAAAAGLIFSYSSCERHSYEETKGLNDHGAHGDHGDHDGEKHGDGGHGDDESHTKGKSGDDHAKEAKPEEKGRKVF